MANDTLKLLKESGAGKLYESNGFLVPVLTGSPREMGAQYGALMGAYMQNAHDLLITPGRNNGRSPMLMPGRGPSGCTRPGVEVMWGSAGTRTATAVTRGGSSTWPSTSSTERA